MINPKYYQIRQKQSSSNPKAELHTLMKQVQKSRIAVENITTFGSGQGKFKHKIGNLQQQLQSCITNINIQSKRNKVLNQLIAVLKGEMFKYQSTKKKQEEEQEKTRDKQISKYQYQIDQILQKHNEEIAKIHNLKELANGRRSERVVYSNLFKKLQRQIKHYQEIYKEQLMISQYAEVKTAKMTNIEVRNHSPCKQQSQPIEERKKSAIQETMKKNNQRRCSNSTENAPPNQVSAAWNGFITANKEENQKLSGFSNYQKKFHPTNQDGLQKIQLRGTFLKQQKFQYTKELLKQISQYTNMIQHIKVHAECSNSNEVLDHYSHIENDNKKLVDQIKNYDEKIDLIIQKNQKVNKLINQQEVARRLSVMPTTYIYSNDPSLQNSNITQIKQQQQLIQLTNQAKQIGQICGILSNTQNQNNVKFNNQFFKILDNKISLLCNQLSSSRQQNNKREDTLISQTIVDSLLQKMDKYQNCERILDQNLFRQEYYKELSKRRPGKSKKDTTR